MNKLLVISICLMSLVVKGQSLEKSWYCAESKHLCVTLNAQGYSTIDELERIKFKRKGNQLKIMWYNNQTFFGWKKETYLFTIEKLTDDILVLSQDVEKNQFEHIPGNTITFVSIPEGCSDKWKEGQK